MDELSRLLGLAQPPIRIESYDISNLAGGGNVAGMVVLQERRTAQIRLPEIQNQRLRGSKMTTPAQLEVIRRRTGGYFYLHYEQGNTEGLGQLPRDLILLQTGGKGHVAAVRPVILMVLT